MCQLISGRDIDVKKGAINIGFKIIYRKEESMYSGYIPGFDIYFSAPTETEIKTRSKAMISTFFDFWIEEQSWKQLFLKLHKLGFRTKLHDLAMKDFLKNKPKNAKFSPKIELKNPYGLKDNQKEIVSETQLAI